MFYRIEKSKYNFWFYFDIEKSRVTGIHTPMMEPATVSEVEAALVQKQYNIRSFLFVFNRNN